LLNQLLGELEPDEKSDENRAYVEDGKEGVSYGEFALAMRSAAAMTMRAVMLFGGGGIRIHGR
jgi:hypothetical protein